MPANLPLIKTRADMKGNDFIDWGQFGADWTAINIDFGTNQGISGGGGIAFTITRPTRLVKLTEGLTWEGNFASGDAVVFTNLLSGPLNIVFATPVRGAGAQIQINEFLPGGGGKPFTGIIRAFDVANNRLGRQSLKGSSNAADDNSAIFLGLISATASIKRIEFEVIGQGIGTHDNDLAINRLELKV